MSTQHNLPLNSANIDKLLGQTFIAQEAQMANKYMGIHFTS